MISERLSRTSASRWLGKGVWALTDQTLFAVSNFGLNILLARWLSSVEYAAWSLAFSAFLLVGALHTALFVEPMLVFAPSRYKDRLITYVGVLIQGHWSVMVPVSGIFLTLGIGTAYAGQAVVGRTILAFALAGPCILFQWLMRRACYTQLRPDLAASAGIIYMSIICAGAYTLFRTNTLSILPATGLLGLASLISGTWLVWRLGVIGSALTKSELSRAALANHWTYGRWAVATNAMSWVPGNVAYLVLPFSGGLESVAALRAVMNVLLPVQHIIGAVSGLLIPLFAGSRTSIHFRWLVVSVLVCFGTATVTAWIGMGLFGEWLIAALYHGRYVEHAHLLWYLGFIPVATGLQAVLGAALRALERPDKVFWAYLLSAVGAMTFGVAMVLGWGITGAVCSFIFSAALSIGAMTWQLSSARTNGIAVPVGPTSLDSTPAAL